MTIPVTVCAKNEAATLGACLDSLLGAVAFAEARLPLRFAVTVVLDDCSDGSEAVARARPVHVRRSTGGKVEAQRLGVARAAPFYFFCDADIVVERDAIHALAARLQDEPALQVVCARKRPAAPERRTWLAQAIHVYNLHRGFARERGWFTGQLFAIRRWAVPTAAELAGRAARLPGDRFYQLERGLYVDDVYLSRALVAEHGPAALGEAGAIWFRAPETFSGMYRYYRRMRREIERIDLLFPETRPIQHRFGVRRTDATLVAAAGRRERALRLYFSAAIWICRLVYRIDRAYHRYLADSPATEWTPIPETKRPLPPVHDDIARPA